MSKKGLVLEGGGVKGAFQYGVLKALEEEHISFDGVVGTSIGAVNGALYVTGGVKLLEKVWTNIHVSNLIDIDEEKLNDIFDKKFKKEDLLLLGKKLLQGDNFVKEAFVNAEAYYRTLITEEDIRKSKMEYGLVTFSVLNFKGLELMKEQIPLGELIDYIAASATFPIFPPKQISGNLFLDGGIYDNMPYNLLIKNNYDKIVVIRTNVATKMPKQQPLKTMNMFYICPEENLGTCMAFNEDRAEKFMKLGYEAGKKAIKEGLKEYLKDRN